MTKNCQLVLNMRRNGFPVVSLDNVQCNEFLQCLRQHLLRNAFNRSQQFPVSKRPMAQRVHNKYRPFARQGRQIPP